MHIARFSEAVRTAAKAPKARRGKESTVRRLEATAIETGMEIHSAKHWGP